MYGVTGVLEANVVAVRIRNISYLSACVCVALAASKRYLCVVFIKKLASPDG